MIVGHHQDIHVPVIHGPLGILDPHGTADHHPAAVVTSHRLLEGGTIQGLFRLEMKGTIVAGLTLVHRPTAGRGAKTMKGGYLAERGLRL